MTILLIILLVCLVIYLYYQNQQLKSNSNAPSFPGSQSEIIFSAEEQEIQQLKESIAQLQAQIDELKKMMTKDQLAQEIKQEFAKGNFKPSQLKRSKSTGDISPTPPLPNIPLKKSPSQPETSQTLSPEQEISQLQEQIKFHAQTSQNYLQSLQAAQAKITELEEELQAKEAFVDASEENPAELKAQIANLEQQILELRLKNLKDFGEYYEEKKALKGELEENIDEGVQEIRRLENKLLALNRKKLTLQSQLQQAELKNTRLELKAIDNQPKTNSLWSNLN
ncbi:7804_t:CDS:1 [Entrophospora sp. SA101]|nr:11910_t:CDS:1 [Entrophospora sp. SA101]CAJ0761307.1 7804_t:CDS:1 [Entrophospora sp. SA101]CAJ0830274.1 1806_t:CDS:1 [Entrophospora sp. SA101]CAJ0845785.1 4335_t:CDS:1 [Entrophospora sp. SA101]